VPPDGLVHVDVDADAFGAAYPDAPTVRVQADVAALLDALRPLLPAGAAPTLPAPPPATAQAHRGPILPQTLLAHLQQAVVEGSNAPLIAESGNAFLWANSLLRFDVPGRYRVSGLWGSMGHATSGVLGLAAARGKAFALVGDGAMLMMNEVSTAVQYDLPAVWVILNDARMGIVEKGMQGLGLRPFETDLPPTDFAALSRAMGADGVRVTDPADLPAALAAALAATGPFVVDVLIDPDEPSPFARRVSTLNAMGANSARSTP
jgi:acetolactate synthase-1/2/3 large subunit